MQIEFTIQGEPASKANSRRLVKSRTGRPLFIKSQKALDYTESFRLQCPKLDVLMEGDVSATIHLYYQSRRPDLDPSIVLDAMQGLIYKNDRQVKEQHVFWHLSRNNPRAIVNVTELAQ